jgi:hypothetical protein
LKDVSYFTLLLLIVIFIYTLLGMELFANLAKFDENGNVDMVNGTSPLANFDTFLDSFTTVFIVLTNDIWSRIFYNYYRTVGPIQSILYFVSLIIIG